MSVVMSAAALPIESVVTVASLDGADDAVPWIAIT